MQKRKILVLQLARLGDIYQTWPVLRALKRAEPECELHLMTRDRFAAAAPQDGVVDRLWKLDSREILAPLVDEIPNHDESLQRIGAICDELAATNFDLVVNLSFSPFSSYIAREAAGLCGEVRGFTRTSDGYLSIPDDGSAYFYAQVGVDRGSRVHVTDLFAHVAGVVLADEDWSAGVDARALTGESVAMAGPGSIVVHIGASELSKTLSWSKWMQVLKGLGNEHEGNIVVVGSQEEAEIAERACSFGTGKAPVNLVGKTTLPELFEIIRSAKCVVGGDSAPIHIAALTGTPCFNLSFPLVSFWETGPRSAGSRILRVDSEDAVSSERIVDETMRIVRGKAPSSNDVIRVAGRTLPYVETIPQPRLFEWELLKAIYMGEAFPAPPSETFLVGIERIADVNSLALEQLEAMKRVPGNKTAASIIDRCDEIMDQIVGFVPELAPIVRWFRTERLRIGPMQMAELMSATVAVHERLGDVLKLYVQESGNDDVVLE